MNQTHSNKIGYKHIFKGKLNRNDIFETSKEIMNNKSFWWYMVCGLVAIQVYLVPFINQPSLGL
jgi:hypothetical protein